MTDTIGPHGIDHAIAELLAASTSAATALREMRIGLDIIAAPTFDPPDAIPVRVRDIARVALERADAALREGGEAREP